MCLASALIAVSATCDPNLSVATTGNDSAQPRRKPQSWSRSQLSNKFCMVRLITGSVASSNSFPLASSNALPHIAEISSNSILLLSNKFVISEKYLAVSGSTFSLHTR